MYNRFEEYLKGSKDLKELRDKISVYAIRNVLLSFETDKTNVVYAYSSAFFKDNFEEVFGIKFGLNTKDQPKSYYWYTDSILELRVDLLIDDENFNVDTNHYLDIKKTFLDKTLDVQDDYYNFYYNNVTIGLINKKIEDLLQEKRTKIELIEIAYTNSVDALRDQIIALVENHSTVVVETCELDLIEDTMEKLRLDLESKYGFTLNEQNEVTFAS